MAGALERVELQSRSLAWVFLGIFHFCANEPTFKDSVGIANISDAAYHDNLRVKGCKVYGMVIVCYLDFFLITSPCYY